MIREDLEDLYPLTPMQQGMLLHCLRAPNAGLYLTQVCLTLGGEVDLTAVRSAWRALLHRHPVFRTAFLWEGLDEPLQAVLPEVAFDLERHDWSTQGREQAEASLQTWLAEERARGFELSAPPLMRVSHLALAGGRSYLVWTCHHLLVDGWSQGLILKEFATAYRLARRGEVPTWPEAPRFRDYLAYLQSQPREALATYWRQRLAGLGAPTPLGVEGAPANASRASRGALKAEVPPELCRRLVAFAREHQLTLSAVFAGAWGLLLGRYSGEGDVLFGATVSGRQASLRGVDGMVGMLINAVPLRLRLPAATSLVPWLREAQTVQLEAQEHAHCSVPEIRQWARLPNAGTLFDSLVVFENFPLDATLLAEGGLPVEALHSHDENHDTLTLTVNPRAEGIALELSYQRERFHPSTLERMRRHYQALLQSFVDTPSAPLSELAARAVEDVSELSTWEGEHEAPPPTASLPELLEERARKSPTALAVACGERKLTYAELNARANQLARRLRALGVVPEAIVPILAPRDLEAVVGMMAVAKAGGAWAPVDTGHPASRVKDILGELEARVVLASGEAAARLAAESFSGQVLRLDSPETYTGPDSDLEPVLQPQHLAYVIYTSGTTGRPKGVMVEHGSLMRVGACWMRVYRLADLEVRLLQIGSFAADVFIGDWMKALLVGGSLVICPDEKRLDLRAVHKLLDEHRITVMESTPGFIVSLGDYLFRKGLSPRSLKLVIFGADYLRTAEFRTLMRRFGSRTRVVNGYGLTECTIESSLYESTPEALAEPRSGYVPLGRPFPGTRFLVLDETRRRQPIGVVGELYVGGPGVARGYFKNPELTAERFVELEGERFYRTGDLARWSAEGVVEHFGRGDHMVKVRGYRVELGEVENALLGLSGVRQAAVVPLEDGQALCAYVSLEPSAELVEIQSALRERLPAYMHPARFVALEALPLNANGKVDRKALPRALGPESQQSSTAGGAGEPRSELEARLVAIWKDILGVQHVGLDDSFLALGGTSIQLLRLFNQLQEQLGAELEIADLFSHHTVRVLARHLEGRCTTLR